MDKRTGPSNGAADGSSAGAPASEPPRKRQRLIAAEPQLPEWANESIFTNCLERQIFPHVNNAIAQVPGPVFNKGALGRKVSCCHTCLPSCPPSHAPHHTRLLKSLLVQPPIFWASIKGETGQYRRIVSCSYRSAPLKRRGPWPNVANTALRPQKKARFPFRGRPCRHRDQLSPARPQRPRRDTLPRRADCLQLRYPYRLLLLALPTALPPCGAQPLPEELKDQLSLRTTRNLKFCQPRKR
ncbi:hypothetical protein B0T14DRAFT_285289 [Immersiella caudata]|uniref:Uncharacterized protein n=1 Tax=Immersiella caudata TaxID=314043 RepID=A0AA39WEA0_9PEZI|nr:hypothetical protein B0T14DRAFT_285289 [Immersiella caudata]